MPSLAECELVDGAQTVYFEAGGEWGFLRTPPSYVADRAAPACPCVLHCHGNKGYVRQGEADWLDQPAKFLFVDEMLQRGIAVAESHACGNHWGRPNAVAAVAVRCPSPLPSTATTTSRDPPPPPPP
eukprot:COSAG04_NODE_8634_length_947_cov_3.212264_1_plen_126_part_01